MSSFRLLPRSDRMLHVEVETRSKHAARPRSAPVNPGAGASRPRSALSKKQPQVQPLKLQSILFEQQHGQIEPWTHYNETAISPICSLSSSDADSREQEADATDDFMSSSGNSPSDPPVVEFLMNRPEAERYSVYLDEGPLNRLIDRSRSPSPISNTGSARPRSPSPVLEKYRSSITSPNRPRSPKQRDATDEDNERPWLRYLSSHANHALYDKKHVPCLVDMPLLQEAWDHTQNERARAAASMKPFVDVGDSNSSVQGTTVGEVSRPATRVSHSPTRSSVSISSIGGNTSTPPSRPSSALQSSVSLSRGSSFAISAPSRPSSAANLRSVASADLPRQNNDRSAPVSRPQSGKSTKDVGQQPPQNLDGIVSASSVSLEMRAFTKSHSRPSSAAASSIAIASSSAERSNTTGALPRPASASLAKTVFAQSVVPSGSLALAGRKVGTVTLFGFETCSPVASKVANAGAADKPSKKSRPMSAHPVLSSKSPQSDAGSDLIAWAADEDVESEDVIKHVAEAASVPEVQIKSRDDVSVANPDGSKRASPKATTAGKGLETSASFRKWVLQKAMEHQKEQLMRLRAEESARELELQRHRMMQERKLLEQQRTELKAMQKVGLRVSWSLDQQVEAVRSEDSQNVPHNLRRVSKDEDVNDEQLGITADDAESDPEDCSWKSLDETEPKQIAIVRPSVVITTRKPASPARR